MKKLIDLIGETPLIEYKKEGSNTICLKLEKFNLGGSVKDRAVLGMLNDAIEKGQIVEGTCLIEATSGNTGIALALMGALKKIPVTIIMPETMSVERQQLIKAYGARLILTPGSQGMQGSVGLMDKMLKEDSKYMALRQFDNPANPAKHYATTAEEILKECPQIDVLIAGVGTGGTISGIGKRLKEVKPECEIMAVEPETSQMLAGRSAGSHKIQGIGANFVPNNFNRTVVDRIIPISSEEAIDWANKLAKDGLLVGISSGAAFGAAMKVAQEKENSTIVVVMPDGLEKYISMGLFE